MALKEYRKKRDFTVTPEPAGDEEAKSGARSNPVTKPLLYVIQKHRASHLHYDFRLEWHGVLLSWAVPKGPSLDPSVKRLAMPVEDHPIEYGSFEGVIPEGEYGGGTVMVWDRGSWTPEVPDIDEALRKGDLKLTLHGEKLKGSWVLVRTAGYGRGGSSNRPTWLLIKHLDAFASTADVTVEEPRSAATNRLMAEIAQAEGGDVQRASDADPIAPPPPAAKAATKPASTRKRAPKKSVTPKKPMKRRP